MEWDPVFVEWDPVLVEWDPVFVEWDIVFQSVSEGAGGEMGGQHWAAIRGVALETGRGWGFELMRGRVPLFYQKASLLVMSN